MKLMKSTFFMSTTCEQLSRIVGDNIDFFLSIHVLPTGRDPDEDIDKTELWLAQIRSIRAHSSDSVRMFNNILSLDDGRIHCRYGLG